MSSYVICWNWISKGSSKTISWKFREVFHARARILREIFPTDVCYVLINARALTLYYKPVSSDPVRKREGERKREREREGEREQKQQRDQNYSRPSEATMTNAFPGADFHARENRRCRDSSSFSRSAPYLYVTTELRHSRNNPWEINES